MEDIIINVSIGVIAIGGFIWYWGRASGCFNEGGVVYEAWKSYREKKKAEKENNNSKK